MTELNHLIPAITNVLTAPGVDLTKISAKSVRKNMLAADETLDPGWVKQNKEGIDELIAQIFNTVNSQQPQQSQPSVAASPSASSSQHNNKRKREDDEEHIHKNGNSLPPSQMPISRVTNNQKHRPSLSSEQKVDQQQLSDAELARQLSAKLNPSGRATRGSGIGSRKSTSSAGGGGSKGGRGSAKKVKSSAKIVDDSSNEHGSDEDGDDSYNSSDDAPKKRRKKSGGGGGGGSSEGGGRAKGGFAKEFVLSEPLAALTGEATLSRPQVVKALWKHIKENQLQNPKDGRVILCDDKLRAVFRTDRIGMFKMNKDIGDHLFEP